MKKILFLLLIPFCIQAAAPLTRDGLGNLYLNADERTTQIRSVKQCGTSCGYFALYNGVLIAKALQEFNRQYLQDLRSQDKAVQVEQEWRGLIVKRRSDAIAAKHIRDMLLLGLKADTKEVTSGPHPGGHAYALRAISDRWLSIQCLSEGTKSELDSIVAKLSTIADRLVALYGRSVDQNYTYTCSSQEIKDLFGEQKLPFRKYFNELTIDITVYPTMKVSGSYTDKRCSFRAAHGDWLLAEEYPLLIDYEKMKGRLSDSLLIATFGDYGIDMGHVPASAEFSELERRMKETSEDLTALVLTYVSNRSHSWNEWLTSYKDTWSSLTKSNTNGHYIALVVHRQAGQTSYYVADSLGNCPRLDDETIDEVIYRLGGSRKFFRSKNSKSFFPALEEASLSTKIGITAFITSTIYLCYKWFTRKKRS